MKRLFKELLVIYSQNSILEQINFNSSFSFSFPRNTNTRLVQKLTFDIFPCRLFDFDCSTTSVFIFNNTQDFNNCYRVIKEKFIIHCILIYFVNNVSVSILYHYSLNAQFAIYSDPFLTPYRILQTIYFIQDHLNQFQLFLCLYFNLN